MHESCYGCVLSSPPLSWWPSWWRPSPLFRGRGSRRCQVSWLHLRMMSWKRGNGVKKNWSQKWIFLRTLQTPSKGGRQRCQATGGREGKREVHFVTWAQFFYNIVLQRCHLKKKALTLVVKAQPDDRVELGGVHAPHCRRKRRGIGIGRSWVAIRASRVVVTVVRSRACRGHSQVLELLRRYLQSWER